MQNAKLFDEILGFKDKQDELAAYHEKNESWEMAYLAEWSILEHGIKQIVSFERKRQLLKKLIHWKVYLEGTSDKKPKKGIQGCTFECQSIPKIGEINGILGNQPSIEKVLKSGGKYRDKRNRIAHRAEIFGRKSTYLNYKETLKEAISEFVLKLSEITEKQGSS